eukprot:358832-Chlamydomonas_euryale.AAC.1
MLAASGGAPCQAAKLLLALRQVCARRGTCRAMAGVCVCGGVRMRRGGRRSVAVANVWMRGNEDVCAGWEERWRGVVLGGRLRGVDSGGVYRCGLRASARPTPNIYHQPAKELIHPTIQETNQHKPTIQPTNQPAIQSKNNQKTTHTHTQPTNQPTSQPTNNPPSHESCARGGGARPAGWCGRAGGRRSARDGRVARVGPFPQSGRAVPLPAGPHAQGVGCGTVSVRSGWTCLPPAHPA